jgi:hypothetical protein
VALEGVANAVCELGAFVRTKAESHEGLRDLLLLINGGAVYVDEMEFSDDDIQGACAHLIFKLYNSGGHSIFGAVTPARQAKCCED